jgi:hypothetical protein
MFFLRQEWALQCTCCSCLAKPLASVTPINSCKLLLSTASHVLAGPTPFIGRQINAVILGAALALPSYISYAAFHSFTKHRFLCNLTSGSNAYIPSNTSIQPVAGTARPPGHGPEGPVADDRKNDLPIALYSPATPRYIANLTTRFLPSTPYCERRVRTLSGEKYWF